MLSLLAVLTLLGLAALIGFAVAFQRVRDHRYSHSLKSAAGLGS